MYLKAALGSAGGEAIVGIAANPAASPIEDGYWLAAADGSVFAFGTAGDGRSGNLAQPIVGIAATPHGEGYWLATSNGGIFSFGDAAFFEFPVVLNLSRPIVGIAAAPAHGGLWLVDAGGGVFNFGLGASFFGSAAVGVGGAAQE